MNTVDNRVVSAFLTLISMASNPSHHRSVMFHSGTPGKNKGTRNKDGLPAGYPGAKLARAAMRKTLTLRHLSHAY